MTLVRLGDALEWRTITDQAPALGATRKEPGFAMFALFAAPRRDEGQGLAEYALILSLIAVIAIAALVFLGTQISTLLSSIGAAI
jgi:pilus assembly protein Flp/PilA